METQNTDNKISDSTIRDNILNKINKEEIKMTSRQYFLMKWLTLSVTSLFFLGIAIYLFAYVTFLFFDNGLIYIPFSSATGLSSFIIEVPWTLVFLGLLSVFLFSITSKTFYKIYRKPFLTFFFSILMIIVISHIIFVETGAMQFLKEEAFKENLKLVPEKFLQFRSSQTGNLFVGYVVSTTTNSLIIRDRQNNLLELVSDNAIDLNTFLAGQLINAYGQRLGDQIVVESVVIVR